MRIVWKPVAQLSRTMTDHHTMLVAGGVAFSSVLAVVPALIAVIAVYGLFASPSDVESNLSPLIEALPEAASEVVVDQLERLTAVGTAETTVGLIVGLIGVAWAISNAINGLVMAIRIAHEVPSPHTWIQGRIFALKLSFVAVLATAAVIWLAVVLPPVLDSADVGGAVSRTLSLSRWPLVVVFSATALALLYRSVVGHRTGRFHAMSIGAAVGTGIWVASTVGLSVIYANIGRLESTFGSLGAIAALMVWIYMSALAALIGAEVDGLLHRSPGSDLLGS